MAQSSAIVRGLGRVLASCDAPRSVLLALVIPHQYAADGAAARRWAETASMNSIHAVALSSAGASPSTARTLTLMPLVAAPEAACDALAARGVVGVELSGMSGPGRPLFAHSCVGLIEDAFAGASRGAAGAFPVRLGLCLPQATAMHPATPAATATAGGADATMSGADIGVAATRAAVAAHDVVVLAAGFELWGRGSEAPAPAVRGVMERLLGPAAFGRGVAEALLGASVPVGLVSAETEATDGGVTDGAASGSIVEKGAQPSDADPSGTDSEQRGAMPCMPDPVSLDAMSASLIGSVAHVVIGGTFDRLHAGHWKLITAAALLARERLTIGVTSDAMVAGKRGAELIAPQAERVARAAAVARACAPGLRVECPVIDDPMGPSATDPSMGAIVVSSETAAGAAMINRARWEAGLGLLLPYCVKRGDAPGLSSTALRQSDLAAPAATL